MVQTSKTTTHNCFENAIFEYLYATSTVYSQGGIQQQLKRLLCNPVGVRFPWSGLRVILGGAVSTMPPVFAFSFYNAENHTISLA